MTKAREEGADMMIVGVVDYHPSLQTIIREGNDRRLRPGEWDALARIDI
jgi:hypothetical protein